MTEKALNLADSFNKTKCKEFMESVLVALGADGKQVDKKGGGEPIATLRQIMRSAALQAGFHPQCIAEICGCTAIAALNSTDALNRRMTNQEAGGMRRRVPDKYPIRPLIEKAHEMAKQL